MEASAFTAVRDGYCRLYLVRHGQTVMNREVRFRGRLDVPLNEVGREEAWQAARGLQPVGLRAVYSSPLGRAMEVAEAIADVSATGPVQLVDDLINLDYGDWEGLTKEQSAALHAEEFDRYLRDPERAVCPNGEAVAAAADRAEAALLAIGRRHACGESVAAVTHGVMVRLAVLRVAGPSADDWQFAMPTGSAVVFDVHDDKVSLARPLDRSEPDPRKSGAYPLHAPRRTAAAG